MAVNAVVAVIALPTVAETVWVDGESEATAVTVIDTVAVALPLVAPVPVIV